jgi:hypothetical protein
MTNVQAIAQRDEVEEELVAWLRTKPTQQLRQFLATAWVASLLSPEAIEELYHELQHQEAASLDRTIEAFIEIGQD